LDRTMNIKSLLEHVECVVLGTRLEEAFGPEMYAQYKQELSVPDMRPQTFDVSVEGWIARIELWGRLKIKHIDPENRKKEDIGKAKFINTLADDNLNKMFGTWSMEDHAINKLEIYRDYIGMNGNQYRERFIVEIDLKDELKKAIKSKKVFGLF